LTSASDNDDDDDDMDEYDDTYHPSPSPSHRLSPLSRRGRRKYSSCIVNRMAAGGSNSKSILVAAAAIGVSISNFARALQLSPTLKADRENEGNRCQPEHVASWRW
jgi:hypothetical protein